jgi:hypothetical protein
MYVPITLLEGPKLGDVDVDHEPFIDALVANLVLSAGTASTPNKGVRAAIAALCDLPQRRRSRPTRSSPAA